jgi:hypothetical protein
MRYLKKTNANVWFDNRTVYESLKKIGIANPGFKKINKALALAVSSVTSNLRFSDWNTNKSIN